MVDVARDTLKYWLSAIELMAMEARANDEDYLLEDIQGGTTAIGALGAPQNGPQREWVPCIVQVVALLHRAGGNRPTPTPILAVPAQFSRLNGLCALRPPADKFYPAIPRKVLLAEGEDSDGVVVGYVESTDMWLRDNMEFLEAARLGGNWSAWWSAAMSMLGEASGVIESPEVLENVVMSLDTRLRSSSQHYTLQVNSIKTHTAPMELQNVAALINYLAYADTIPQSLKCAIEGTAEKSRFGLSSMVKYGSQMFGVMDRFDGSGMRKVASLDNSQRRAILAAKGGVPVTAVTGPPGTGKTTALRAMIADAVIRPLVSKDPMPKPSFILATSATNKAVTNVIRSFSGATRPRIDGKADRFDQRWIRGVPSFGWYAPSRSEQGKLKTADNSNLGNTDADQFMAIGRYCRDVDSEHGLDIQTTFYGAAAGLDDYYRAVGVAGKVIVAARDYVATAHGVIKSPSHMIARVQDIGPAMLDIQERLRSYVIQSAQNLSNVHRAIWKVCSSRVMPPESEVAKIGHALIMCLTKCMDISLPTPEAAQIVRETHKAFMELPAWQSKEWGEKIAKVIERVEVALDSGPRLAMFHMAARYWEARFLASRAERLIAGGSKVAPELARIARDEGYQAAIREEMRELLFLAPCIVATAHTMPTIFGPKNRYETLIGIADTLIIDEGGQAQPEVVGPAMAFARETIVLGDNNQLEPVRRLSPEQDRILLRNSRDAKTKAPLTVKTQSLVSVGTVMDMAVAGASYASIILTQHYRCRPEIIGWSNATCYSGMLEPMRPALEKEKEGDVIPTLGYMSVTGTSTKDKSGSVRNTAEASALVDWIFHNRQEIETRYKKPLHECVGILTPYASQTSEIRRLLITKFADMTDVNIKGITLGSVYGLQGAERELVLFSAAADVSLDERVKVFLDRNFKQLNVAVTRAMESFIIVASPKMIERSDDLPVGSFMSYVRTHGQKVLVPAKSAVVRPRHETAGFS